MHTDSFDCEFGYELIAVLPYAYWLYENHKLEYTVGCTDTQALYYFSSEHRENYKFRGWKMSKQFFSFGYDNAWIHVSQLNTSKFKPPPYKEYYKNTQYQFPKPLLVICNKYTIEWKQFPLNYYPLEVLAQIFDLLQDSYQIIYNNMSFDGVQDVNATLPFGDIEMIRAKYPKVLLIQDIATRSYNETQLKVYANCNKFLTLNGGNTILASYFGGDNIVFTKKCQELTIGSYEKWYHLFGGAKMHVVSDYKSLINKVKRVCLS